MAAKYAQLGVNSSTYSSVTHSTTLHNADN